MPIAIRYPTGHLVPEDEYNVLAALRYPDRICEIDLTVTRSLVARSYASLRAPFPALERLRLRSQDYMGSLILPTAFLGGAATRLRDIHLESTVCPMLPRVLSFAHELVSLRLDNIPISGYISPDFLATGLAATTRLKHLVILFLPPMLKNMRITASSPQNRAVLPALTDFQFRGDVDYLENLVTRIDAPSLEKFTATLFEQSSFDIPHLSRFISRAKAFRSPHHTSIELSDAEITFTHDFHLSPASRSSGNFKLHVSCDELDLQMPTLVHISRQLTALFASPEQLDVAADLYPWRDPSQADSTQWLEVFHLFPDVKRLRVSSSLVFIIASTLEQATGTSDVLPSLLELHLGGSRDSMLSSVERFVTERESSGYPVSVHYQSGESDS